MSAPEKIYAWRYTGSHHEGQWNRSKLFRTEAEYTRADIADARVAAAYEAAAEMLAVRLKTYSDNTHNLLVQAGYDVFANRVKPLLDVVVDDCPKAIRALTPDDAKATLEAVRREALKDAAEQFMQMHREHMAYLERDPDNYVSAYYTASIELRALAAALGKE